MRLYRHHRAALWRGQEPGRHHSGGAHQEVRAVPSHQQRVGRPVEAPVPAVDQPAGPPDLQVRMLPASPERAPLPLPDILLVPATAPLHEERLRSVLLYSGMHQPAHCGIAVAKSSICMLCALCDKVNKKGHSTEK